MDKIELKVNNIIATKISGWENIRIKKSMQSIADNFSMNIFKGDEINITNNDVLQILLNDKVFFTGYLDDYNLDVADKKKPLVISGRSKAMDLIDCNILSNKQYNKLTIVQIIKDLISPFNISISSTLSLEPLETFSTKIGETYFNAINRLCKQTNTLPISDELGNIKIIKNQNIQASDVLTDQDLKSLRYKQKFPNRFSEYVYKKETEIVELQDGKTTDSQITRFRPFVDMNNEDKTNQDMAIWQKNNNISKSISLSGTVVGWDPKINTIQKLETEIINNSFLIKEVEYIKGNNGTISNITFVDKSLFKG